MQRIRSSSPLHLPQKKIPVITARDLGRLFLTKIPQPVSHFIQRHPFYAALVGVGCFVLVAWVVSQLWPNPPQAEEKPLSPVVKKAALNLLLADKRIDSVVDYVQSKFKGLEASTPIDSLTIDEMALAAYDLSSKLSIDDLKMLHNVRYSQYDSATQDADFLINEILVSYLQKHHKQTDDGYNACAKIFENQPDGLSKEQQDTLTKLKTFLKQAQESKNPSALWKTELGQYLQVIWLIESYRILLRSNPVDEKMTKIIRQWIIHKLQKADFVSLTGFCLALKRESGKNCPEQQQLQSLLQEAKEIFTQAQQTE